MCIKQKNTRQLVEIIITNLRQWKHISINLSVQTSEALGKAFKIVEKLNAAPFSLYHDGWI